LAPREDCTKETAILEILEQMFAHHIPWRCPPFVVVVSPNPIRVRSDDHGAAVIGADGREAVDLHYPVDRCAFWGRRRILQCVKGDRANRVTGR